MQQFCSMLPCLIAGAAVLLMGGQGQPGLHERQLFLETAAMQNSHAIVQGCNLATTRALSFLESMQSYTPQSGPLWQQPVSHVSLNRQQVPQPHHPGPFVQPPTSTSSSTSSG
jgi:hypothetical protein